MLRKLIKHEFIASYRRYVPFYIALLGLAVLNPLTSLTDDAFYINAILLSGAVIIVSVMSLFTIYNMIISLGRRVYGKPGYLLFTLPVKTIDIMLSKILVNLFWIICTVIISIITFAVTFYFFDGSFLTVFRMITLMFIENPMDGLILILALFIYALYSIAILMFLFSFLNLIYKGERKILMGLLIYFGMSIVIDSVYQIFANYQDVSIDLLNSTTYIDWSFIGIYTLISSILYISTYYMMDRSLELQ
ncbi:hypothetical protein [Peloplasma aerotolerans]|uniref:ABC transporter permease n=1 Tax=Peloplasma aerotolerans TaxID=3044389 RepID=A0AAW6U8Z8_9MOLU|nr:hypothetical protein [Mariniplasma sp. M4Ah]MDI6452531.1 hypothetical protein [Mariniplasma sp. M4Ah]